MANQKTFNLKAITGKGNFDVIIKVYEEETKWNTVWMDESFLIKGEKKYKVIWEPRNTESIKCPGLCIQFGVPAQTPIKCDTSQVSRYISTKIDADKLEEDEQHQDFKNKYINY